MFSIEDTIFTAHKKSALIDVLIIPSLFKKENHRKKSNKSTHFAEFLIDPALLKTL